MTIRFGLLALELSGFRAAHPDELRQNETRLRESLGAKSYKGGVGNLPAFISFKS